MRLGNSKRVPFPVLLGFGTSPNPMFPVCFERTESLQASCRVSELIGSYNQSRWMPHKMMQSPRVSATSPTVLSKRDPLYGAVLIRLSFSLRIAIQFAVERAFYAILGRNLIHSDPLVPSLAALVRAIAQTPVRLSLLPGVMAPRYLRHKLWRN